MIGNYTVRLDFDTIKEIGQEGRNSKVYLAHDNQLDGEIVIKEIEKNPKISPIDYFKEARILYANDHNNIVKVNYACENDNNVFVAMPFYKNGSLKKKISDGHFLTVREIIRYSIQFLSGLNHIHSRGLIHFDIKPDNIMISDSNEAMLSDFGLAEQTDVYGFVDQKSFYTLHVTPEQLMDGIHQTLLNDIYQAGITIYRIVNGENCLIGQLPSTSDEFKNMIIKGEFPNRRLYLSHIPLKLRKVINKCIEPYPNKRYTNTLEVINALSCIDENLDWRYSIAENTDSWIKPIDNGKIQVDLVKNVGKFNIDVNKTKSGRRTKCHKYCFNNIDNKDIKSKLDVIFAEL